MTSLENLLNLNNCKINNENIHRISEFKSKDIVLYGAGSLGKKIYTTLNKNGLNIICFFDKNRKLNQSEYDVCVYHPEDYFKNNCKKDVSIILSSLFGKNVCKEIKHYLKEMGFKHIYALHEIDFTEFNNVEFYNDLHLETQITVDEINKYKNKILEVYSLLEEEKDKRIYVDFIKAHILNDYTGLEDPEDTSLQYLAHDIEVEKDFSNYIDCGGYDGDVVKNLLNNGIKINNLAIFEPQNNLCEEIYDYINNNISQFRNVSIIPCGVWSDFKKMNFIKSIESPVASRISEIGDEVIQCIPIDKALQNFQPTFIKMDIEGAEIEALKGAKETIIRNHPQLAICVYHSLSDIWEIPLLIKSFYNGYKFYLRSYNYMGVDTVLYAFPYEKGED